MIKRVLERAGKIIFGAIFPSNIYCISCGSLIDKTRNYSLCDKCMGKLHWINGRTCDKCGKALPQTYKGRFCYDCMTYSHYFSKGYSCLTYGMYERELLFDFKYRGKSYLAEKFADILYDRMACEDIQIDVIIPIPVGAERLRKRGYDQSVLMADNLSARWCVPVAKDILLRKRDTPFLRGLSPVERENVLKNVFCISQTGQKTVRSKRILLVDDIYTTGSTADACSKELLEKGAEDIFLLTLASGGNRKPKMV